MDLSLLNKPQREAVTTTEGHIRVIAGAGSGKTRALAYRYAYIVNELGIDPANILCLTFTNKAAQEMRSRISKLVPPGHTNDFVCTIHGFCVRFLREEIFRIGYSKNFQILDIEDMKTLAKQVFDENNTERSVKIVKELLNQLSDFKHKEPYIEKYLVSSTPISNRQNYSLLEQLLLKQKDKLALDFDDLLAFTLYILRHFPNVCSNWQEKISYVLVDETQDCNTIDWVLVGILTELSGNLFVVGDPDQSIYEWRGARPDLFLNFKSDKDIILDENYRSTPGILNVANSIIVHNKNRIEKKMFTQRKAGDSIIHYHAKDEKDEAKWICSRIKRLVQTTPSFSDFAVLYRASYLSRSIEQALIFENIPYEVWGGVRFFERMEIKDCLSYLRLVDSDDDLAFERIINTPSRKVGKVTLDFIRGLAQKDNTSMYVALKSHLSVGKLARQSLNDFVALIDDCRRRKNKTKVSELMAYILEQTGLKQEYREDNDEQRLENITELLKSMRLYEEDKFDADNPLATYLQDIALYTNADYRKETNKVKLMTIHQAKGLEFPYVFVIGLSEGIFPNERSIRERKKNGIEEERRLMYVAVTRAENQLFMTESEGFNFQTGQLKLPSRFIAEIKRNLFVTEGDLDEGLLKRLKLPSRNQNISNDTINRSFVYDETVNDTFHPNMIVEHKIFGKGTVEKVRDDGFVKVIFDGGSIRFVRQNILKIIEPPFENTSNEKMRKLSEIKSYSKQNEYVVKSIIEYLHLYRLSSRITFKYSSKIFDVDVIDPKFSPDLQESLNEINKIIGQMKESKSIIPSDLTTKQNNLETSLILKNNVRYFENCFLGFISYLKLDGLVIDNLYYSPRIGLIIQYKGFEPISVKPEIIDIEKNIKSENASSIKEFDLDKTPIPKVKGKSSMRVTLEDGTIIQKQNASDTFILTIEHIGIEKVKALGIKFYHCLSFVDLPQLESQGNLHELSNREYILMPPTKDKKAQLINAISEFYDLKIKAELVPKL